MADARLLIQIDLVDCAGTRYPFCNSLQYDAAAEEQARAAAARFHGTTQTYYPDDPERSVDEEPEDPNADLIGFRFMSGIEEIEVIGPVDWSEQYVLVQFPSGYVTIKPAALVRQKKEGTWTST